MNKKILFLFSIYLSIFFFVFSSISFASDPFLPPWMDEVEKEKVDNKEDENLPSSVPVEENSVPEVIVQENISEADMDNEKDTDDSAEKMRKPDIVIHGVIWQNDGTGMIICDGTLYKVGDFIDTDCKLKSVINGTILVSCGSYVWKYRVSGGGGE